MGRPVPGYRAACCWLRSEAAAALKSAHEEAAAEGLRLVVYDCYRPPAATAAFLAWSQESRRRGWKKADYYPNIDKKDLFDLGYIARQSTHTTGLAVDLAFEGLDFGTPFDLFDERSDDGGAPRSKARRARTATGFLSLMTKHSFENLPNEWWHFTYKGVTDPAPVDFDVI